MLSIICVLALTISIIPPHYQKDSKVEITFCNCLQDNVDHEIRSFSGKVPQSPELHRIWRSMWTSTLCINKMHVRHVSCYESHTYICNTSETVIHFLTYSISKCGLMQLVQVNLGKFRHSQLAGAPLLLIPIGWSGILHFCSPNIHYL